MLARIPRHCMATHPGSDGRWEKTSDLLPETERSTRCDSFALRIKTTVDKASLSVALGLITVLWSILPPDALCAGRRYDSSDDPF